MVWVKGGISTEATINRVADESTEKSPVVAEELGLLSAELTFLGERASAFRNFANRSGETSTITFANTLIQAERYGTSLSGALRSLASDLRDQRMQKAERKAAALPAQLTVRMIWFFMPILFIVILGPAFITAMAAMKQ
jgi:tight adherence protein C